MPIHKHDSAAGTSSVYGTVGNFIGSDSPSASGVFSVANQGHGILSGGGGWSQLRLTLNGSITPSITTNNTGNGSSHNIIQPFYTVYCWRRTA